MKLFIFEYYGSYVGGTIVAIAPDMETLAEMMKKETTSEESNGESYQWYPPVLDPVENAWFNILMDIPGHVDGMPKGEVITAALDAVEKFAPNEHKKEWAIKLSKRLENDKEHGYGDGRIRTDWALHKFTEALKDGVYLTHTIEVKDSEQPRIVSHTCHSG